jgi:hypothetical protein
MSTGLATRLSPRCLAAALVAGLAFTVVPTAPAAAADYPAVRQPRAGVAPVRVRAPVRAAVRYVPVYCAEPGLPYYWAVRYARYRHAHGYYY